MTIVGYHITRLQSLTGVLMLNDGLVGKYSCQPAASETKLILSEHYHNTKMLGNMFLYLIEHYTMKVYRGMQV
jgi:hypothetical protein